MAMRTGTIRTRVVSAYQQTIDAEEIKGSQDCVDAEVTLSCPRAVLEAFREMCKDKDLTSFKLINGYSGEREVLPSSYKDLTARHLQMLARIETENMRGRIDTETYNGVFTIEEIGKLRCLVKATTVSGLTKAHHRSGEGYRDRVEFKEGEEPDVIIIDQSGLQWQESAYNTGAMFFDSYLNAPLNTSNGELTCCRQCMVFNIPLVERGILLR